MKTIEITEKQMEQLCVHVRNHSKKEVYLMTEFGKSQHPIDVFPLTKENMELIPDHVQFGNYRIGIVKDDEFWVRYFGRSDNNQGGLRQRVKDHIGDTKTDREKRIYDHSYYFWFEVKSSAKEAYEQECKDYHTFIEIDEDGCVDNDEHPDKLDGMSYLTCPVCGQ